mgnify:CR=1 FL=1
MILEKLKQLLGIHDDLQDTVLEFIISDVEETIKNYCNLEEVPKGLLQTSYRMRKRGEKKMVTFSIICCIILIQT